MVLCCLHCAAAPRPLPAGARPAAPRLVTREPCVAPALLVITAVLQSMGVYPYFQDGITLAPGSCFPILFGLTAMYLSARAVPGSWHRARGRADPVRGTAGAVPGGHQPAAAVLLHDHHLLHRLRAARGRVRAADRRAAREERPGSRSSTRTSRTQDADEPPLIP
ncbi:hypothetical protein QJS66_10975 [Kocuria rhizophila]|nr:hypothetical protein QJS66_10975 [Kocuria rhizophila]